MCDRDIAVETKLENDALTVWLTAEKLTALRNCLRELEAYYMQTVQNHTIGVGGEIAGTGRTEMPDSKRQKGGNRLSPFFLCDNIG